jgi:hypothetical protein
MTLAILDKRDLAPAQKQKVGLPPLLFIKITKSRNIATFFFERFDFSPELDKKVSIMVKEFTKLFFEEFYPRSQFWQKSKEAWKNKARKWKKDLEEYIKAYLEGSESFLCLPPFASHRRRGAFLYVGRIMILKMETKLVLEFSKKALRIIERYLEEFGWVDAS